MNLTEDDARRQLGAIGWQLHASPISYGEGNPPGWRATKGAYTRGSHSLEGVVEAARWQDEKTPQLRRELRMIPQPLTQLHGDCIDLLPTLARGSVRCVVTSPPYYALRDYGLPPTLWPEVTYSPMPGLPPITLTGCAPDCDHEWGDPIRSPWANENPGPNGRVKNGESSRSRGKTSGEQCKRCGGWRGCLGLEPDPLMFIGHLVHIFRLLREALADDGTAWLNLGDSYAAGGNGGGGKFMAMRAHKGWGLRAEKKGWRSAPAGTKNKDLLGIPWRAALALQADGWYLRNDVIWDKPNCMPESAPDRLTRSHEYVFLLAKSKRYYFDNDAIAEQALTQRTDAAMSFKRASSKRGVSVMPGANPTHRPDRADVRYGGGMRRRRSVWSIPAANFDGAHYAVMPDEFADLCIRAGSQSGDLVLDPFGGTGTVARRAIALGRHAMLMDLNPAYIELQNQRTAAVQIELEAA
jgi:DNA modification methylase